VFRFWTAAFSFSRQGKGTQDYIIIYLYIYRPQNTKLFVKELQVELAQKAMEKKLWTTH
jgi:hypothetical protein